VIGDELGRVHDALSASPIITTVILRNSPGGHILTGYRIGELFRERGLRTAVSGFCYSSCSRMFLGGRWRHFTDDYPLEYTHVGFHGHYGRDGRLNLEAVDQLDLKGWIIRHSDGRADVALVERWVHIPYNVGMIHFYHPLFVSRRGASTFLCEGPGATLVFACEPIAKTALDLGVVTSLDLVRSNDRASVRATIPLRPAASGWADVEDVRRVPLEPEAGQEEYRRFLRAPLPRAFAVSPTGQHWAWNSGTRDVLNQALLRCAQRSGTTCKLYAVDEVVVWQRQSQRGSRPTPFKVFPGVVQNVPIPGNTENL